MNIENPISSEQRLKEAKHWFSVIGKSIESGDFEKREQVENVFEDLKFSGNTNLHIFILASRGAVDSYLDHLYTFLSIAKKHNVKGFVHLFSDGQDVPEKQFLLDLPEIQSKIKENGCVLASISGRFYAMDEEENWERINEVCKAFMNQKDTPVFKNAQEYVKSQYQTTSDKWIVPAISEEYLANGGLGKDDVIVNLNFLKYGTRELCSALVGSIDLFRHRPKIITNSLSLYTMVCDLKLVISGCFFESYE